MHVQWHDAQRAKVDDYSMTHRSRTRPYRPPTEQPEQEPPRSHKYRKKFAVVGAVIGAIVPGGFGAVFVYKFLALPDLAPGEGRDATGVFIGVVLVFVVAPFLSLMLALLGFALEMGLQQEQHKHRNVRR